MIKKMRREGEGNMPQMSSSARRQTPRIMKSENEHNLILSYEGGKMRGEREKHNEAEREAERGKAKCLSSRPKKAV